jgi:5'-nucleotidase / UDP-sugar diphosphatase
MQSFSQSKRFTLLHTSDEHSVLIPLPAVDYHPTAGSPSVGGFARLATLVKQIREQATQPVLLLSAGDFIGGSPYAWLILEGASPEIGLMTRLGYDAVTIGNHEFDYGPDILADYLLRSGYPLANENLPLISANLNIPDGHRLHEVGIEPHRIFELENGLKVGVFGILGNTAYSLAPLAEPVDIFDPISVAQQQVDKLRQAGADVVVLLSHSGIEEDHDFARKVNNIDVILGGHDHQQYLRPVTINGTLIMHSSYYLRYLGVLELEYDSATRQVTVVNDQNNTPYQIALDSNVREDEEVAALVQDYTSRLNDFITRFSGGIFTDVLAPVMASDFEVTMHAPMVETTVGNFVADAMRLEAQRVLGERVDFAIQANGVIRGDIIPGVMDWSKNQVSFMDLVTIAGLGSGPDGSAGYPMVSIYLTAEEIYNVFEIAGLLSTLMGDTYFLQVSGGRYSYDPGKAIWLRVPVLDLPVPAYKSLKELMIYEGEGLQHEDGYKVLDRNSERLYHLVADHYLTGFLPMIGNILPRLKIVLKDKHGNPAEVDETIIMHKGREFKVWEAVALYAMSFERGESGLSEMPDYYRETQGRIVATSGTPLYVWAYSGLFLFLAALGIGITALVKWIRRRIRRN